MNARDVYETRMCVCPCELPFSACARCRAALSSAKTGAFGAPMCELRTRKMREGNHTSRKSSLALCLRLGGAPRLAESGASNSLGGSALLRGFELRVDLANETLSGRPRLLYTRVEVGGDFGGHDVVL